VLFAVHAPMLYPSEATRKPLEAILVALALSGDSLGRVRICGIGRLGLPRLFGDRSFWSSLLGLARFF
jgi:hypothetical protein